MYNCHKHAIKSHLKTESFVDGITDFCPCSILIHLLIYACMSIKVITNKLHTKYITYQLYRQQM